MENLSAYQIVDKVWANYVEYPFRRLNLLQNPVKRFVVFGVGTAAILWIVKPKSLFDDEGSSRAARFAGGLVPVHWASVSAVIGGMSVLFV